MKNCYSFSFGKAAWKHMLCFALLLCFIGMNAQQWSFVGSQSGISSGGSSFQNLSKDAAGNIYISYYDVTVTKGSVQKYDGTSWSYLGGSAGITTGTATYNSLSTDAAGNVYYTNQAGWPASGMEVRKFNGTAWSQLPNATNTTINIQASAVAPNGTLIVANNEASGTVKRFVNGAWEQIGANGFAGGTPSYLDMVVGSDNTIYVSYVINGNVYVMQNDINAATGLAWEYVGGGSIAPATSSEQYRSALAIDADDNLYIAYASLSASGNRMNVKKYNGTVWSQVGAENFSDYRVHYVNIAISNGGVPYVVFSTFENSPNNKNTVMRFNGLAWENVGEAQVSAGEAKWNSILFDNNGDLILAYSDSDLGKTVVRKFIVEETPVTPSVTVGVLANAPAAITQDNGTLQLVATVAPLGSNVVWTIVNGSEFATVTNNGFVAALANGTVTIRATLATDPLVYDDIDVVISNQMSLVVSTDGEEPVITENQGYLMLSAYLNGDYVDTPTITWSVVEGGTGNAAIDIYGKLTAMSNGVVTVRATLAADSSVYGEMEVTISNQQEGYCEAYFINGCSYLSITSVTTAGGLQNITNNSGCSNVNGLSGYGDFTLQTVTAVPNSQVTFSLDFSTDTAFLSAWIDWNHDFIFDENERVYFSSQQESPSLSFTVTVPQTALPGTTRIRLKAVNGWEGSGPCGYNSMGEVEDYTFNVVQQVNVTEVEVHTMNDVASVINTNNGTLQLVAVVSPNNATNTNVVWTITAGEEFATVSTNGLVTATANGTVTVRATSVADNAIFDEIEVVVTNQHVNVVSLEVVTANDAAPVINTVNGTLQLEAIITPNDATTTDVTWTITAGTEFAGVDDNGLVTAAANGTITVRATAVDNDTIFDEIEIVITNQHINVVSLEVVTADDAAPAINTVNGTLQLEAIITPDDATTTDVTWTITAGTEFATVDADGLVTATANGIVTVRATSVDNDAIFDEIEITINIPTAGIGEHSSQTFTVYPNPVQDMVTISALQPVKQVEVYNVTGQKVYSGQQTVIDLSGKQQGVYILQVQFEDGTTATQKLIKE